MGASFSRILSKLFGSRDIRILMLGLDSAGKTTILYKLKLGQSVTTIPTVGFNVESVTYKNIKFNVWDVGGQDKIRPLWRHYFAGTQGLIFVVDSNDPERLEEARAELHRIVSDRDMQDCAILVFANKQDLPRALNPMQVTEILQLPRLQGRLWYVHPSCATTGEAQVCKAKFQSFNLLSIKTVTLLGSLKPSQDISESNDLLSVIWSSPEPVAEDVPEVVVKGEEFTKDIVGAEFTQDDGTAKDGFLPVASGLESYEVSSTAWDGSIEGQADVMTDMFGSWEPATYESDVTVRPLKGKIEALEDESAIQEQQLAEHARLLAMLCQFLDMGKDLHQTKHEMLELSAKIIAEYGQIDMHLYHLTRVRQYFFSLEKIPLYREFMEQVFHSGDLHIQDLVAVLRCLAVEDRKLVLNPHRAVVVPDVLAPAVCARWRRKAVLCPEVSQILQECLLTSCQALSPGERI
ncbi:hypothetical protein HK097_002276 [Rhizophlyctis rosea]|uniref:ADP-ribosylation factor 6 n=1 Tax=Rhizophlyctis rosea TaxID=64517 RepID=A0AAD5S680_9FUNG|nr:hypothetical protein HK097_002276 [Rhizophlyctis rosea]